MESPTTIRPSPETVPFFTYLWVLVLSAWGGFVSYRAKVIASKPQIWSVFELIGEMTVATFCGVVMFYGCQYLSIDLMLTAVCVSLASHMGTKSIALLEERLKRDAGL